MSRPPQQSPSDDASAHLPLTLGVECSGTWCSVAIVGGALGARPHESARLQPGEQLTFLLPMILERLAAHEIAPHELARIAVSVGPGSFTGLRLALTTVRTMALVLGCPVVAVPTLDCIAWQLLDATPHDLPFHEVAVVTDARKGQVFAASWAPQQLAGGWQLEPRSLPQALEPQAAASWLEERGKGRRLLAGGNGFTAYPVLGTATSELVLCAGDASVPRASAVARAGAGMHGPVVLLDQAQVEPVYLREPDITPPKRRPAAQALDLATPAAAPTSFPHASGQEARP